MIVMKSRFFCCTLLLFITISSGCNRTIEPEELYGEWKYIRVESPREDPPVMSDEELAAQNPSIIFTKNKDLVIIWGGEKLSHGKFRMDGQMIRYKENLAGGTTREFPFLIKSLSDQELVFETMSQELTRVTAVRK